MSFEDVVGRVDATFVTHIQAAGERRHPKQTWCGISIYRTEGGNRFTKQGVPVHTYEGDEDCDFYCPVCLTHERQWAAEGEQQADELGP